MTASSTNNLNTFHILYLIKGILTLFFSLFFIAYAAFGGFMGQMIEADTHNTLPFNPALIFMIVGIIGFVLCLITGVLTLFAAKFIKEQKNYTFVFVIAILNCLSGMLGIILGVFTIVELNKPEIKALFGKA